MKRFFTILMLVLLVPAMASAAARPDSKKGLYWCQALTGGATGAVDALDITGASTPNQYDLIDGDAVLAATISGTTTSLYLYVFDADGTSAEDSPTVIRPDDYSSAGVWRLTEVTFSGYSTPQSASAQYNRYYEASGDGSNYHDIQAQAFAANRTSTLPDYNIGYLASTQVDSGGDMGDNTVDSEHINTIVDSIAWNAAGMNVDGTQCADPTDVTINSGPIQHTIICADNDGSTMYGHVIMPDSWDGGTVTFEGEYLQTAADTSALNSDVTFMCRGAGETVNNTWASEAALDDAAVTGSNAVDHTTTAAITPNGTCAGGDTLYWRWQLDATGTTTAVATLHFLGAKIEYTSNVGD